LVGLAAIGRERWLSGILPGLVYLLSGRLEIGELWADGVAGADTARSTGLPGISPLDPQDPDTSQELNRQVQAVAHAWSGGALTDTEVRSAATTFVVAKRRSAPVLSHRVPIVRAATASDGTRRVACVGAADLAIWLARGYLEPVAAWEFYEELSSTAAGEQAGWRVPQVRDDFYYWAGEAATRRR
jgi:hypothetical protein